jgi:PTH1 family peptidyl-tRNA hydrolase
MIKLFVFLGNPGSQYTNTRHNIAWQLVDFVSEFRQANWSKKFKGEYCKVNMGNNSVVGLMPHTFMNLSGESVVACSQFFKINPAEILVVHDELDLEYGQIMLKDGGGVAGHNGLKSIMNLMGTKDFKRLRMGIGKPNHPNISSFVLSDFSKDEKIDLDDYFSNTASVIEKCANQDFKKLQNNFNKKYMINNKG